MSSPEAIVAGNGPSLKTIDYSRLPQDFEVFRCNQFYFEDKYFLGKKVRATTFAMQTAFEQIYTMLHLNQNQEYDIQSIFLRDLHYPHPNREQREFGSLCDYFSDAHFIHRIYEGTYSPKIKAFLEYTKLQELYFYKHASSGILLCAIAVALGHKRIHLTGIDFYESKAYAFDTLRANLLKLTPCLRPFLENPSEGSPWHSKQADLEALEFLSCHYGVSFYSLSPHSPMSAYFPLSPQVGDFEPRSDSHSKPPFEPMQKSGPYTQDILLPPPHAYEKFNGGGGWSNL